MDMPTTAAAALVVVLAVLPGVPGDHIYRVLAGVSWRERDATHLLRLLAFSVTGLIAYVLLASRFRWPSPDYIIPATYSSPSFGGAQLASLGIAYFGHFVGSALMGLCTVGANAWLSRIRTVSASRDSWDHFVRCSAPEHWIVVTLQNRQTYAGILDHADVSAQPEYRDLIIREPYLFHAASGEYRPTFQQFLFVRGTDVVSIAAIHSPDHDKRVVPAAESPFTSRSENA